MPPKRFTSDEAKDELRSAIEAVESVSAAEVVVSVRPRSGTYRQADYLCGQLLSVAGLLFMLYAPWAFALHWIAVLCALLFIAGALLCRVVPPLQLALATRAVVDQAVQAAARERFYDLGVSNTRDRSGLLVYVSLREKRCAVLTDVGVRERVPSGDLDAAIRRIEQALRQGPGGLRAAQRVAQAIRGTADLLSKHLVRREDDENELPDLAD